MRTLSPLEWAVRPLKKYAVFSGRAPRAEYWWFYLATFIAGFATSALDAVVGGPGVTNKILNLALMVPSLAVLVRRLHDTDRSGWWLLVFAVGLGSFGVALVVGIANAGDAFGLTPILVIGGIGIGIALITLFIFTILPGTAGPNRYGPDPYGPDGLEEVFA